MYFATQRLPWVTSGLPNPGKWREETDPKKYQAVTVTDEEVKRAYTLIVSQIYTNILELILFSSVFLNNVLHDSLIGSIKEEISPNICLVRTVDVGTSS